MILYHPISSYIIIYIIYRFYQILPICRSECWSAGHPHHGNFFSLRGCGGGGCGTSLATTILPSTGQKWIDFTKRNGGFTYFYMVLPQTKTLGLCANQHDSTCGLKHQIGRFYQTTWGCFQTFQTICRFIKQTMRFYQPKLGLNAWTKK
jgi:hypothetical protein